MEEYHWNSSDDDKLLHRGTYEPTSQSNCSGENSGKKNSFECLREIPEDGRCPEASGVRMTNSQFFERLKSPILEEMEQKMDEFWLNYIPLSYHSPSNYELRASSSLERQRQEQLLNNPEQHNKERSIRLVTGPSPQHIQIPEWVYHVRSNEKLFKVVLDFYFSKMHWPDFRELPYWFRRKCSAMKVDPENFRLTSGFAPVWVFLLKELCDADSIEKEWMTMCIDKFFDRGEFPGIKDMPVELEELCQKMKIQSDNFYEVLND